MRSGRALVQCSISVLAAIVVCAFATGCKIGFNEDVASAAFAKSRAISGLTISPGSGDEYAFTVVNIPTIAISSALPSAKIFYSLDGAAYAPYAGPFALVVDDPKVARTYTLSAYASDPEWNDSPVVSRRFAFTPTVAPSPAISPTLAIPYEYNVASVPTVTLATSLPGSTIKYAVEGVSAYENYSGPFAFPLPANLSVPADMRLVAYCTHPQYLDSAIVTQDFRYVTNVPAPIITPMALPSYDYTVNSVPTVEITCAQSGSSILRSIDGAPYVAYAAPFALPIPGDPLAESDVVVTAYAAHSGYLDSSVSSQTYHFIPTVPTPSIAPAPARYYQYNLPPTIVLSCTLAGTALYSRVDGVSGDAAYLAPFPMPVPAVQTTSQNLTLRAYGTKAGFVNSLEATMTYLFAASGSIVTFAGDGGTSYAGENVDAVTVSLDDPEGIALDGTVALYIADTGRHRVRKVDLATGLITTFAGTSGTAGYAGDGGLATSATLSSPSSLAVDNNYVYICDRDNNCVRRVDKGTGVITTYVGMGPLSPGYNGDGGALASTWLYAPEAIALDSNDKNLYIADTLNHRIRKIVIADSLISTVAGNGTEGFSGDGNLAVNARLDHPQGVGIRLSNKFLYIADTDNHRLRAVDPGTGFISTVAGTGVPGYSGEGNPLTATLSSPTRVAVDNTAVYISDTGNNRVRKLDGVISTIAGTGTDGFSGEYGPAPSGMVSSPVEFVPSNAGYYLADRGNGRVRKILRY